MPEPYHPCAEMTRVMLVSLLLIFEPSHSALDPGLVGPATVDEGKLRLPPSVQHADDLAYIKYALQAPPHTTHPD
jgi:hypothetical protein